jgi:glycosyltransferase involved in cell wall biosynthesis
MSNPLISCVMPTADRPAFVRQSLACFIAQDYAARELVIVDTGRRSCLPVVRKALHDAGLASWLGSIVVHIRPTRRVDPTPPLGYLRNWANQHASGEFIAHWDDDDWYHPSRLPMQASVVLRTGGVVGQKVLYYFDRRDRRAWLYHSPDPHFMTTLMYDRDVWAKTQFGALRTAEDVDFLRRIPSDRKCVHVGALDLSVCRAHDANTVPKQFDDPCWQPAELSDLPMDFQRIERISQ